MSEYQYYEFRALDKPLTPEQQMLNAKDKHHEGAAFELLPAP